MPILNFKLSQAAQSITQIAAMFDPSPPYQYVINSQGVYSPLVGGTNLRRDTTIASSGFQFSIDALTTDPNGAGVTPFPINSYTLNTEASVFGIPDGTRNVVQINTVLANVEPGYSRLRIDYTDVTGNALPPEYFDCPFYENWDVTAQELNNIVNYSKSAFQSLQKQISDIKPELAYISSREFWKGITVSGQLQWTPATQSLASGQLSLAQFPKTIGGYPLVTTPTPVTDQALKTATFTSGSSNRTLTPTSPAVESQYHFDLGNSTESFIYYWAEAFDETNTRCMVLTLVANWNDPNLAYIGYVLYFNANTSGNPSYPGIDGIDQGPDKLTYDHAIYDTGHITTILANTPGNTTTQMSPGVQVVPPNLGDFLSIGQNSTGNHFLSPSKGGIHLTGQNSSGVDIPSDHGPNFSLAANLSAQQSGYEVMPTAVWDTVTYNGNNHPRLIFYPHDYVTNSINFYGAQAIVSTTAQGSNSYIRSSNTGFGSINDLLVLNAGAPPTPSLTAITNPVCASTGSIVTVNGQNLGSPTSKFTMSVNGVTISSSQITTWNQNTIVFQMPASPNIVGGTTCTYTLDATTQGAGPAQSIRFFYQNVPSIASLTDTTRSLPANNFFGNDALTITGSGFGMNPGSVIFTDSIGTQYPLANPVWGDTQITGTAPALAKGTFSLVVNSQNCGASPGSYQVTSHGTLVGAQPQLIVTPPNVTLQQAQVQQFDSYLTKSGQPNLKVSNSCTWTATLGTIDSTGSYTAPASVTMAETDTITATYLYVPSPDDGYGGTYTATATVTLAVPAYSSNTLKLSVASQINVFLGDGRFGYIPKGTTFDLAYPGDYIYVKFDEVIDPLTKIPDPTYNSIQQLQFSSVDAFDPSKCTSEIYNTVPRGFYTNATGKILVQTFRTVVLGICDPSDGNWHSMWDIGLPASAYSGQSAHSMKNVTTKMAYYGEDLPAFSEGHAFEGSIVDYIDDMAGAQQKQLTVLNKRSNQLIAGNCYFDDTTSVFSVIDKLQVFAVSDSGQYKVVCTVPTQDVVLRSGEFVWINKDNNTLNVSTIGSEINAHDIVVGVCTDRMYSKWPILPQYMIVQAEG